MARNRNRVAAAVCVAAIAGGGVGAGAVALTHGSSSGSQAPVVASPAVVGTTNTSASSTLTVNQIAKQSIPSVVEIDSVEAGGSAGPFGGTQSSSAEGTGFVYDTKGDIATNDHVIAQASSITVKFDDSTTYKATVVGADPATDLAIIHVNAPASKLTPLVLADSSTVAIGDGVVAIGNPFGLDDSVTSGIVSALGREITSPSNMPIENAIQTDAAINHGNSGGPLFDLEGKVIGITAQIQSDGTGNEGVGFAIPSNTVRQISDELIANGKAVHALLGVDVTTAAGDAGATVGTVESGSGADKGGVQKGDVITAAGGTPITTSEQLRAIIDAHQPGTTLDLMVRRNGSTQTLKVTLGTRSSS